MTTKPDRYQRNKYTNPSPTRDKNKSPIVLKPKTNRRYSANR